MFTKLGAMPTWFILSRHDEGATPEPDTDEPEGDPQPQDPAVDADALGDKGKAALVAERNKAKTADAARKQAERERDTLAARVKEFEDQNKSDLEKATSKAEEAERRAQAATDRAVKAEIKALADGFADREDAALYLGDVSKYVVNGEPDTEAISEALADVLNRKPHLAKQTAGPAAPKVPAPDPSQGKGGTNQPVDFRTAPREQFAAELAKHGIRPRTTS